VIPRSHVVIAVVGVALVLPSLGAGFFADDILHLSVLSDRPPASAVVDLFRFSSVDTIPMPHLWWTDPQFRAAFFRPISALTHVVDHRVWGTRPLGYHVTNLVLWALVLLSASALIRRLAPTPRAATLAFLIFAVADAHAFVVTWVANRNALVATALSFAALVAWDSYRRGRGRSRAAVAWILFALAMLAGEVALGGLALLVGYEALSLPEGGRFTARRLAAVTPVLVLACVYAVGYKLAGFGTSSSAVYVDPATSPGAWLLAAASRLPILLAGLLWGWPIDYWMHGGRTQTVIVVGALVLLPLAIAVFARSVRRCRALAAAALGGTLALLPLTATFPSTRLLLLPGVAAALLIGSYLDDAWPLRSAGRVRAVVASSFALRHIVLAPLLLVAAIVWLGGAFRQVRHEIVDSPWPPDVKTREVVLLNAPHVLSAIYLPSYLVLDGRPAPRATFILSLSPYPASVTRTGLSALELRFRCGSMLATDLEQLVRNSPIPAGTIVETRLFRVTVLEAGASGPTAVRFDARRNLDEGALLMRWSGSRYQPVATPRVGSAIQLPAVAQGIGNLRAPAPECRER
jgi:hypothetical protein